MNEDKECAFCKRDTNVLIGDGDIMYTKQEVVLDYKVLLGELKDAQSIKDAFVQNVVRKEGLDG
jgi:hypothetical protein